MSNMKNHRRAVALSSCLVASTFAGCMGNVADGSEHEQPNVTQALGVPTTGALGGWNILQAQNQIPVTSAETAQLDGLSLEWDYFMIHDKGGKFTGMLGYVLSDPHNFLAGIAPSGGNVAISGKIDGQSFAEFKNFPNAQTVASATTRSFSATDVASGEYGRMTPTDGGLLLEGRSASYEWSVFVKQDWASREALKTNANSAFTPVTGFDIGGPGEMWTVDMVWPRTKVEGTITELATGEEIEIEGHGYRENTWGRWAFVYGGWDFDVVSDAKSGVQLAMQTYFSMPRPDGSVDAPSTQLDYLDVSFHDKTGRKPRLVSRRFTGAGLSWGHPSVQFEAASFQCQPQDIVLHAEDGEYVVEVAHAIGAQEPILSNATPFTASFVINEQFPIVTGKIFKKTGNGLVEVTSFQGQGGGEFAGPRAQQQLDDATCTGYTYYTTTR